MKNNNYDSIGVIEISFYANAVFLLDAMVKAAQVDFLMAEKLLGGRMVTVIVGGTTSNVSAAVEAARHAGESMMDNPVKVAVVISNPHTEIMKFIVGRRKQKCKQ
ncbi:MAG: BMC domain-containing protein [Bacillota bacterium]